jgi:ribonuclease P protein component
VLNRRHRLLTSDDFRTVFRRGKKVPVDGGLVAVRRTETTQPFRCGFVVSKSVGNAVVRNLVKRRLRAASGLLVDNYSGVDLVVRADHRAADVSVDTWRQNLVDVLDRVIGR